MGHALVSLTNEYMYAIIGISSGIVMAKFSERGMAVHWLECNNLDDEGNSLNLFQLIKVKHGQ